MRDNCFLDSMCRALKFRRLCGLLIKKPEVFYICNVTSKRPRDYGGSRSYLELREPLNIAGLYAGAGMIFFRDLCVGC